MTPDLLAVGHIVKDIVPGGWRPGGSVVYAAAQAARLGLRVAAVTSCANDVDPTAIHHTIEWRIAPSDTTTTFENRYVRGRREQRLPATARPLRLEDIPEAWRSAPIVLLAPVFHDLDPALPRRLTGDDTLIGLGAQGWLRRVDGDRVLPGRLEVAPPWLAGNAVFVSDEDVEDAEAVSAWQQTVPIVVLTRARAGCTVWDGRGRHDLPAFEAEETDPTGAGDVFAAAFLIRLKETGDAPASARFAAAAAALSVRRVGLEGIAGRDEIAALLHARQAVQA